MTFFSHLDGRARSAWLPGLALLVAAIPIFGACGTIMHGTTQPVSISSAPTGAQVTVDGFERGVTPVIAELKRKDHHMLRVAMDGYEPFEMGLTRSVSGWVWGNIVFGGLIGLAVDAISGGLYKLSPDQVMAELRTSRPLMSGTDGVVYLTVVLRPMPGAERIGQLVRE
ncbi:MAG: PEGA domain-containing protein [Gemmatimonadota bacterium]